MGLLDGLFGSTDNTEAGFNQASQELTQARQITDPFYQQNIENASVANNALSQLLGLSGDSGAALDQLRNTPGYQFALERGQGAIDQSAIARGGLNSGATLKSLTQFGQGLADQQYQNRVANLSGFGQTGFQGAQGLTNGANTQGQIAIGRGQAIDAGNVASAGNALGLLGTATGFASGGGLGRLFGGGSAPTSQYSGFNTSNLI